MLEQALPDLESWVAYYRQVDLPVLKHTLGGLEKLRANAENANARTLSSVILHDPLMTLRVLAYLERNRGKRQDTDITTIGRALMMMGVNPFFKAFENVPLLEEQLKPHPQALLGLLKVVTRSRRATGWARDWAVLRHDVNAEEIAAVTLLHDVTEILMWCFAPSLALKVRTMQDKDPSLRSADAQREVYGLPLNDLQAALVRAWRLPPLLIELMDPEAEQPRVLNVRLAVDLARHSAHGWEDAALPDDFRAIEKLLSCDHEFLMVKLGLAKG